MDRPFCKQFSSCILFCHISLRFRIPCNPSTRLCRVNTCYKLTRFDLFTLYLGFGLLLLDTELLQSLPGRHTTEHGHRYLRRTRIVRLWTSSFTTAAAGAATWAWRGTKMCRGAHLVPRQTTPFCGNKVVHFISSFTIPCTGNGTGVYSGVSRL